MFGMVSFPLNVPRGANMHMNFADIGNGHGELCHILNIIHGIKCVGIESVPRTERGAIIHGHKLAHNINGASTFLSLLGDALHLTDFGGADVVYAWLKRAPSCVIDHILDVFVNHNNALY